MIKNAVEGARREGEGEDLKALKDIKILDAIQVPCRAARRAALIGFPRREHLI